MGRFASLIKNTVKISGVKYSAISERVKFDGSYISKWINADVLPAPQSAHFICKQYAELVLQSVDTEHLPELLQLISQDNIQSISREQAEELLSKALYDAYQLDRNEKEEKPGESSPSLPMTELDRFSMFTTLINNISVFRKSSPTINVAIYGDLLKFTALDIIGIMDLIYCIGSLNFNDASIDIFLNADEDQYYGDAKTITTFLNLLIIRNGIEINYYITKAKQSGLVICVKDLSLTSAQILINGEWMFISTFNDVSFINRQYDRLIKELSPWKQKPFDTVDVRDLTNLKSLRCFLHENERNILSGSISSILIDHDMLALLLEGIAWLSEDEKKCCEKETKAFHRSLEKGKPLRLLLYREAFEAFVDHGRIQILGREVLIPEDMRYELLVHIKELIDQHPNFNIKVIDPYLVHEIKHSILPTLVISAEGSFFYTSPSEKTWSKDICIITSRALSSAFTEMFDKIWDEKLVPLSNIDGIIETSIRGCEDLQLFRI